MKIEDKEEAHAFWQRHIGRVIAFILLLSIIPWG